MIWNREKRGNYSYNCNWWGLSWRNKKYITKNRPKMRDVILNNDIELFLGRPIWPCRPVVFPLYFPLFSHFKYRNYKSAASSSSILNFSVKSFELMYGANHRLLAKQSVTLSSQPLHRLMGITIHRIQQWQWRIHFH